ncbi:hypothetical protein IFVP182_C160310 [Vibrio parahaemolyticus]
MSGLIIVSEYIDTFNQFKVQSVKSEGNVLEPERGDKDHSLKLCVIKIPV